jgi:hypothetical protein
MVQITLILFYWPKRDNIAMPIFHVVESICFSKTWTIVIRFKDRVVYFSFKNRIES